MTSTLVKVAVVAGIVAVVIVTMPEIKRYMKMSRM